MSAAVSHTANGVREANVVWYYLVWEGNIFVLLVDQYSNPTLSRINFSTVCEKVLNFLWPRLEHVRDGGGQ